MISSLSSERLICSIRAQECEEHGREVPSPSGGPVSLQRMKSVAFGEGMDLVGLSEPPSTLVT